jgi:predicted nucleotidyltransferase
MHTVIETNRDALAEICRRFHVARLEVFGSAADGDFDESRSDIDFLVEFGDVPDRERFDTYFALLHALEDLFRRHIDLVEPEAMHNPYLIRRVNESRKLIYAA